MIRRWGLLFAGIGVLLGTAFFLYPVPMAAAAPVALGAGGLEKPLWNTILTPGALAASLLLIAISAFSSASETAFYSLSKVQLRAMRESDHLLDRLVAQLMEHPGNLLASILMANCIVNVLLGVVLATQVEELFFQVILPPSVAHPIFSYALAVCATTATLIVFGEITPKVAVMGHCETYTRFAAIPLYIVGAILKPIRITLMAFVGFLFRVTRFSEVPPAPFMTDDEFKVLLTEGEASGVIEEDERQMIQGILEFSDAMLRSILVPRKDMLVLQENATVGDALELVREQEPSRMPVYGDNLDDIRGVLYAKDLLPYVISASLDQPIKPLLRKVHFVPETMSAADFVKTAQRLHTHLAIVVDEFGGTEGLVTLHDAISEVVGNIDEEEAPSYTEDAGGVFRVDGTFPVEELKDLTGVSIEAEEHTTVAGFLLEQIDKLPEVGDEVSHAGVLFTIEAVDGKRAARVRIRLVSPNPEEGDPCPSS